MHFNEDRKASLPVCTGGNQRLLYIHVPFCEKLCPYCSFSRVVFDETLCRTYFAALKRELLLYRKAGYDFTGIYVGGGTPTILIDELEETLALAESTFSIREISVETNPNHLGCKYVDALKRVGVKRLSVGIQSFNNDLLRAMDRYEKYGSGDQIIRAVQDIIGEFETLNADMIFNFAVQTPSMLDRDLDILVETGVDQVTYYPLMVSDSTRNLIQKTLGRVDYSRERAFYRRIIKRLLPDYTSSSVWCFSRKKSMIDEYIVKYDEYAGVGSGSFGYLNGICYANTFHIGEYIERINRGEIPLAASRIFNKRDRIYYDLLMKLFGMELDLAAMRGKYGKGAEGLLLIPVLFLYAAGGLRYSNGRFYLTDRGRYYILIMMREFFIAVNNFRDFCRAG